MVNEMNEMNVMSEDFERKMQHLGVHFGSKGIVYPPRIAADQNTFQAGTMSENRLGKFFYVDKTYPTTYTHGTVNFSGLRNTSDSFHLPDRMESFKWQNCVFLDTETTGLSQSAGTFAFMVGVAKFINTDLLLRQYFLINPSQEDAMLLDLSNFFPTEGVIVSYNGIGFDVPILKQRYLLHKMPSPFKDVSQLDLLQYSRALWRYQFNDRSLKSIESKILSFSRASEEVPGWMAPEIYRQFLKSGNINEINGVFYHNAMDVVSLAALLSRYVEILNDEGADSIEFSTISFALAKLHEKNNNLDLSISYYFTAIQQNDLSDDVRIKAIRQLGAIYKRNQNFNQAVSLWELGSEMKDTFCVLELCKYYEHKEKNYQLAMYWVEKGLELISAMDSYQEYPDLITRRARISKKEEKNGRL